MTPRARSRRRVWSTDGLLDGGQRGNEAVTSAAFTLKLERTLETGGSQTDELHSHQGRFKINCDVPFLPNVVEREDEWMQVRHSTLILERDYVPVQGPLLYKHAQV